MFWLLLGIACTFAAGFLSACLAADGGHPAPAPERDLQEPVAAPRRWLIVAGRGRTATRWEFDATNETDALREYFQRGGNPAAVTESRAL